MVSNSTQNLIIEFNTLKRQYNAFTTELTYAPQSARADLIEWRQSSDIKVSQKAKQILTLLQNPQNNRRFKQWEDNKAQRLEQDLKILSECERSLVIESMDAPHLEKEKEHQQIARLMQETAFKLIRLLPEEQSMHYQHLFPNLAPRLHETQQFLHSLVQMLGEDVTRDIPPDASLNDIVEQILLQSTHKQLRAITYFIRNSHSFPLHQPELKIILEDCLETRFGLGLETFEALAQQAPSEQRDAAIQSLLMKFPVGDLSYQFLRILLDTVSEPALKTAIFLAVIQGSTAEDLIANMPFWIAEMPKLPFDELRESHVINALFQCILESDRRDELFARVRTCMQDANFLANSTSYEFHSMILQPLIELSDTLPARHKFQILDQAVATALIYRADTPSNQAKFQCELLMHIFNTGLIWEKGPAADRMASHIMHMAIGLAFENIQDDETDPQLSRVLDEIAHALQGRFHCEEAAELVLRIPNAQMREHALKNCFFAMSGFSDLLKKKNVILAAQIRDAVIDPRLKLLADVKMGELCLIELQRGKVNSARQIRDLIITPEYRMQLQRLFAVRLGTEA